MTVRPAFIWVVGTWLAFSSYGMMSYLIAPEQFDLGTVIAPAIGVSVLGFFMEKHLVVVDDHAKEMLGREGDEGDEESS